MADVFQFSIMADVFCLVLCVVAVFIVYLWHRTLGKSGRILQSLFWAHIFQTLANLLGLVFKGRTAWYVHGVLRVTNFVEFLSGYTAAMFLSLYIFSFFEKSEDFAHWRRAAYLLCATAVLMLVISQFTGMYYTIDEANFYHREFLYPLSLTFGIGAFLMDIAAVICYRKRLSRAQQRAIVIYIVIPVAAILCQPLIYGIYLLLLADTLSTLLMCMVMLSAQVKNYYDREMELERQKTELAESRNALVQSQIQPHFLFNSLNSIYHLCDVDVQKAKQAVGDFSEYLRENLAALNVREPVPFETELKHVKHYLALEKMRFGEELDIVYDIGTVDFFLPQLTIQPLVENAVGHGLGYSLSGGTVTISTRERTDYFEVIVADDGMGFDVSLLAETAEDNKHVGIRNVKKRLYDMCRAELAIESSPGKGTCVTIKIPKEKKQ